CSRIRSNHDRSVYMLPTVYRVGPEWAISQPYSLAVFDGAGYDQLDVLLAATDGGNCSSDHRVCNRSHLVAADLWTGPVRFSNAGSRKFAYRARRRGNS